jgi:hypothetical protein
MAFLDTKPLELDDLLKKQIEKTINTEKDLALLVKERDQQKRKAEKLQHLKNGQVFSAFFNCYYLEISSS